MNKTNWLFLMLLAFASFSCDDDDEDVELDVTAPTINITSPAPNAVFAPGDEVQLRAEIRDNLGLETVRVHVTDPGGTSREVDDDNISDFLNDNREKDLEVDITIDSQAQDGAYIITIEAIDEQDNRTEQSVTISVMQ